MSKIFSAPTQEIPEGILVSVSGKGRKTEKPVRSALASPPAKEKLVKVMEIPGQAENQPSKSVKPSPRPPFASAETFPGGGSAP